MSQPLQRPGDHPIEPLHSEGSNGNSFSDFSESDDYISSGEEALDSTLPERPFPLRSTLAEHVEYFTKSIEYAMDGLQLDKALVVQAQLSGLINDKNQQLLEKLALLVDKLLHLKLLYAKQVANNRIGELEKTLRDIKIRVESLERGSSKKLLLRREVRPGVAEMHPVEYNRARDKILERTSEDLTF